MKTRSSPTPRPLLAAAAFALLGACASAPPPPPSGPPRAEIVFAVDEANHLLRFRAASPERIEARLPLAGLQPGESLVGIDFRVARGVLYGLSSAGRLLTIDTRTALVAPVGAAPAVVLQGTRFGVDFNPAADRLRVVSDSGQNLRLHPDTGALVAADPALAAPGSPAPRLAAAAYTYNKRDDKLTTNYAIDIGRGWLVVQGSIEGAQPVVSPNTGRITDVGALGTGAVDDAAFDIADIDNAALAALRRDGRTALYAVDLASGRARLLGRIGDGGTLRGIAIQP